MSLIPILNRRYYNNSVYKKISNMSNENLNNISLSLILASLYSTSLYLDYKQSPSIKKNIEIKCIMGSSIILCIGNSIYRIFKILK